MVYRVAWEGVELCGAQGPGTRLGMSTGKCGTQPMGIEWREKEQAQRFGIRHPHRFYAKLMGEEREMEEVEGGRWREVAHDRQMWRELRVKWIQKKDLP